MRVLVLLATALAVASSTIGASASGSDRADPVQKVQNAGQPEAEAKKKSPADRTAKPTETAATKKVAAKQEKSKPTRTAATAIETRKSKKVATAAYAPQGKPRLIAKARKSKVVIDTMTTASIEKPAKANGAYGAIVSRHAAANGVPASLAHAVIRVESNYRVDALGRAGEIGLMQIKPSTARMLGYTGSAKGLYNPETNIKYGLKYLGMAHKLGGGNTCGTILRYNAGHAAKRMNPISAAYCSKVKRHLAG